MSATTTHRTDKIWQAKRRDGSVHSGGQPGAKAVKAQEADTIATRCGGRQLGGRG